MAVYIFCLSSRSVFFGKNHFYFGSFLSLPLVRPLLSVKCAVCIFVCLVWKIQTTHQPAHHPVASLRKKQGITEMSNTLLAILLNEETSRQS